MQVNAHSLRVIRERSGYTQQALATLLHERTGFSPSAYRNVELGLRNTRPQILLAIAKLLNVPVASLTNSDVTHQEPSPK